MRILSGISLTAILMAGLATPSFATSLPYGGTVVPNTVSLIGFSSLAATGIQTYSYGGGTDTGLYISNVGTFTGNPFGATDMTFVYQVHVNTGDIEHLTGFDFGTGEWMIDVEQSATGGGTTPAVNATWDFGVVSFNFPGDSALLPGNTSYYLIINTNAPLYAAGTVGLIDGGGTTEPGFEPANTPEPSTLSLLGTGLLVAGAGLRRRMLRK